MSDLKGFDAMYSDGHGAALKNSWMHDTYGGLGASGSVVGGVKTRLSGLQGQSDQGMVMPSGARMMKEDLFRNADTVEPLHYFSQQQHLMRTNPSTAAMGMGEPRRGLGTVNMSPGGAAHDCSIRKMRSQAIARQGRMLVNMIRDGVTLPPGTSMTDPNGYSYMIPHPQSDEMFQSNTLYNNAPIEQRMASYMAAEKGHAKSSDGSKGAGANDVRKRQKGKAKAIVPPQAMLQYPYPGTSSAQIMPDPTGMSMGSGLPFDAGMHEGSMMPAPAGMRQQARSPLSVAMNMHPTMPLTSLLGMFNGYPETSTGLEDEFSPQTFGHAVAPPADLQEPRGGMPPPSLEEEKFQKFMRQPTQKRRTGKRPTAKDPRLDPSIDPKKAKRILANRKSAARSKNKQKESLEQLKQSHNYLLHMKDSLKSEMGTLVNDSTRLQKENNDLMIQLVELKKKRSEQKRWQHTLQKGISDVMREIQQEVLEEPAKEAGQDQPSAAATTTEETRRATATEATTKAVCQSEAMPNVGAACAHAPKEQGSLEAGLGDGAAAKSSDHSNGDPKPEAPVGENPHLASGKE